MPTVHPSKGQPDPETLVTCPYNPSHRVAMKRMQFHITKCRKGHPGVKMECPYNATHMVNEQEFQYHLQTCVDKGVIDNYIYTAPRVNAPITEPLPEPEVPPNEESWDDDYCGTYDPTAKALDEPIIYGLIGGTPSERKKCRNQQRQKFRAMEESGSTTSSAPRVVNQPEPKIDAAQPLRTPNTMPASHLKNPAVVKEPKPKVDAAQPLRIPNTIPASLSKISAQFEALNRSTASVLSDFNMSTKQGKRTAVSSGSEEDKIPDLVPANPAAGKPKKIVEDGFTLIGARGRRAKK